MSGVIVTLTPNPSLDLTYEVGGLVRGEVQRSTAAGLEAGGKGINVARNLRANGIDSRAVVPAGGFSGEWLVSLLGEAGVELVRVPVAEAVRVNASLVEPDGVVTKVNAPGPTLSTEETERLLEEAVAAADGADWIVACGSLPPGVPENFYARLVEAARGSGCRVAVDTSGPPLRAALDAAPDLVKPNQTELAEVVGREMRSLGDAVAASKELRAREISASKELRAREIGSVLVSLGADGAILTYGSGTLHAESRPFTPRSSIGAGDALLAGFLAGGCEGGVALVEAVAWGAAATRQPGSRGPSPADIDRGGVSLHDELDLDRELKGETR
jgi:1-phosphofructokinase